MKFDKLFTLVLGLFFGLALNAQVNTSVENQFAKELKQKSSVINDIKCEFKQTQSLSILKNKIVKEGTFYYKRPERILLAFDKGDFIYMSSDMFNMKNCGKNTAIKVDKNPMLRELKKILSACMSGNVLNVAGEFDNVISLEKEGYVLKMIPKKKRTASKVKNIILTFNKKNMCLDQMVMNLPNGDFTQYEFLEKDINTNFREEIFNITK